MRKVLPAIGMVILLVVVVAGLCRGTSRRYLEQTKQERAARRHPPTPVGDMGSGDLFCSDMLPATLDEMPNDAILAETIPYDRAQLDCTWNRWGCCLEVNGRDQGRLEISREELNRRLRQGQKYIFNKRVNGWGLYLATL